MKYFDFHCDTSLMLSYENKKAKLDENDLHISLDRTEAMFDFYAQIFAHFTPKRLTDAEGWELYLASDRYFKEELLRLKDRILPCRNYSELEKAQNAKKAAAFFAIEDIRLIDGDLSRLDTLYENGCRCVTPVWGGYSSIGGAHNTDEGLTDLGKSAVKHMFELGMIADLSHASEKTADDILEIAEQNGAPVIATHSNSYTVFSHTRNLRDRHLCRLVALGGVVGVSLCSIHIAPKNDPTVDDLIAHIEHYLSVAGESNVCFGADFDGTDLPFGMTSVSDTHIIFDRMVQLGYSEELINKITYSNAENFIKRTLTK